MKHYVRAIQFDLKFQFRHGFYYAYALVSVLYIAILRLSPELIKDRIGTVIIYSDPSVLGFFFMAGIFLMEKQQGVLSPLLATPLGTNGYLISKAGSLAVLSTLSGIAIALGGYGYSIKFLILVLGIVGGSILFTLIGTALVSRAKTLSEFLAYGPFILVPTILPLFPFMNIWPSQLPLLLPGGFYAALIAFSMGIKVPGNWYLITSVGLLWTLGSAYWAKQAFLYYVVKKL